MPRLTGIGFGEFGDVLSRRSKKLDLAVLSNPKSVKISGSVGRFEFIGLIEDPKFLQFAQGVDPNRFAGFAVAVMFFVKEIRMFTSFRSVCMQMSRLAAFAHRSRTFRVVEVESLLEVFLFHSDSIEIGRPRRIGIIGAKGLAPGIERGDRSDLSLRRGRFHDAGDGFADELLVAEVGVHQTDLAGSETGAQGADFDD